MLSELTSPGSSPPRQPLHRAPVELLVVVVLLGLLTFWCLGEVKRSQTFEDFGLTVCSASVELTAATLRYAMLCYALLFFCGV